MTSSGLEDDEDEDEEQQTDEERMQAFLAWRQSVIEPYFQRVLSLLSDFQDDEDLSCEARVQWEGLRHHWSLVQEADTAGSGYHAYVDVCIDLSDPEAPRLEIRSAPDLLPLNVQRLKEFVSAATGMAVAAD